MIIHDDDSDVRPSRMRQLKWALQALAIAGSEQRLLFPDYAAKPDELALDFDNWAHAVGLSQDSGLTGSQREALRLIDEKLAAMSRDGAEYDADVWTESALEESAHWAAIRTLAVSALDAFGWPVEPPTEDAGPPRSAGAAQG